MSSSDANVVKIVESCAELWANQRVSWWVQLTGHAVRLEAENSCGNEIYVISPSSDDGVSVDRFAGNSSGGKALLETLPGISESDFFSLLSESVSNE